MSCSCSKMITEAELTILAVALQHYYADGRWPKDDTFLMRPKYMAPEAKALFLKVDMLVQGLARLTHA